MTNAAVLDPPPEILRDYGSWVWNPVSNHPGNSVMYRLSNGGEERFLKVVRKGWYPGADDEVERTTWARAYLPVPEIIHSDVTNDATWFLSAAVPGVDATDARFRADVPALVDRLGRALRRFHDTPVEGCPFSFRLDDALRFAEQRLHGDRIDPARDFHPEHAHLSAEAAVHQLVVTRPVEEDLVVCHGDFCAPNVLLLDGSVVFVDLGELGVADRWWDLAVATWSLTWNFGPGFEAMFLASYGASMDEDRCRYYRLLYDVVS